MTELAGRRARAAIALGLVLPLVLLQSLEAADLFCDGLAHASLLSTACPHHATRHSAPHARAGSDGHDPHATGERSRDGAARHTRSDHEGGAPGQCTCPRTGNSLPDGLILIALAGIGVPVESGPQLNLPPEVTLPEKDAEDLRPSAPPRTPDHPPKLQA